MDALNCFSARPLELPSMNSSPTKMLSKFARNSSAAALIVGATIALSGCAAGDVEMNGALFDYLGMGKAGPAKASQASDRQGLVVPPSLDRLPEPGSGAAATASMQVAMPVNPETRAVANVAEQQRQQAAFCDKAMMTAKLNKEVGPVPGPFGVCNPSLLQSINGANPLENLNQTQTYAVPKRN
jgi:hypothetical protein